MDIFTWFGAALFMVGLAVCGLMLLQRAWQRALPSLAPFKTPGLAQAAALLLLTATAVSLLALMT